MTELQCDNQVGDHYNDGIAVGVIGTPVLIREDSIMVPFLVSPQQLKQRLEMVSH